MTDITEHDSLLFGGHNSILKDIVELLSRMFHVAFKSGDICIFCDVGKNYVCYSQTN